MLSATSAGSAGAAATRSSSARAAPSSAMSAWCSCRACTYPSRPEGSHPRSHPSSAGNGGRCSWHSLTAGRCSSLDTPLAASGPGQQTQEPCRCPCRARAAARAARCPRQPTRDSRESPGGSRLARVAWRHLRRAQLVLSDSQTASPLTRRRQVPGTSDTARPQRVALRLCLRRRHTRLRRVASERGLEVTVLLLLCRRRAPFCRRLSILSAK